MGLKPRYPGALVLLGAILLPCGVAWGRGAPYTVQTASTPVVTSTAPLTDASTEAVPIEEEPFVSPIGTKKSFIVSGFGKREAPGQPKVEMHEGVDWSLSPGSAVRAARSGKVIFAGFSTAYVSRTDKNDKHRLVIVRHEDGQSTRYVHLNALRVRPMQEVKAGQVLGVAAESDEWTEPVLHFEVRDPQGQPIDPETVIAP